MTIFGTSRTAPTLSGKSSDTRQFRPHIRVLHSQRIPQPIFAAVLTGSPWRWLCIPSEVLKRTDDAQLGWVRWRCRTHFQETRGRCYLFGRITGFEWVKASNEVLSFEAHGRQLRNHQNVSQSGGGYLLFRNELLASCLVGPE